MKIRNLMFQQCKEDMTAQKMESVLHNCSKISLQKGFVQYLNFGVFNLFNKYF